jgi:cobalt-precorrin 5A hydrolase
MSARKVERIAVAAVSWAGCEIAARIVHQGLAADLYVPATLAAEGTLDPRARVFDDGIHALTSRLFTAYDGLVFVMPMGIVVRAIAPHPRSKHTDPAVVTVDVGGRWCIATLSGHEGGANELAAGIARVLHTEAVITTSTEAVKTLVAGIGCRKGVSADDIAAAVDQALVQAGCSLADLRQVVTVDAKQHEPGLLRFCEAHGIPLRVVSREQIRAARVDCVESAFVKQTLGIGAVAVPCALLGGHKTELLTDRIVCKHVTVALAREHCEW